nr:tetratricopeptide repeat protein [Bacteroidota bacterium]
MNLRINLPFLFIFLWAAIPNCFGQAGSLSKSIENDKDSKKQIDRFIKLADIYIYRNLDSALFFVQDAIIKAKNAGYEKGEIEAINVKAEISMELGEYDRSETYADRIKEYALSTSDKKLLANYHLLKGGLYLSREKYNQALEQLERSLDLFREQRNLTGMGDAQRKIAHCLLARREYDIMRDYEMSALDCYEQAGYKRGISAIMNNFGFYFNTVEIDYNRAEEYFRKAIKLNTEEGNSYWLSKNYINLSMLKEQIGQVDSAFYYCESALKLSDKLANPLWKSVVISYLGRLNYEYRDFLVALDYFQEALALAEQINSHVRISYISSLIQKIYYENEQPDSAYHYLSKYYIYKDSLLQNNSDTRYAELKYKLEVELNEQKMEARYQRLIYILIIIAILLAMITIIFYMHSNKQRVKIRNTVLEKENLTKNIELKNKELATHILVTQKKNEVLGNVISELKENLGKLPEPSRRMLRGVIQNLSNTRDEKGWEDFE